MRGDKLDDALAKQDWDASVKALAATPTAGRSISTLIKNQGIGDLYELYAFAKRNNMDYNLTYIPTDFPDASTQAFDPAYMGKLFDLGFQMESAGNPWKKEPPRWVH